MHLVQWCGCSFKSRHSSSRSGLPFLTLYFLHFSSDRLEYKYEKLIASANGELPAAETCALSEGEEDDVVFQDRKGKGNKFFNKFIFKNGSGEKVQFFSFGPIFFFLESSLDLYLLLNLLNVFCQILSYVHRYVLPAGTHVMRHTLWLSTHSLRNIHKICSNL